MEDVGVSENRNLNIYLFAQDLCKNMVKNRIEKVLTGYILNDNIKVHRGNPAV